MSVINPSGAFLTQAALASTASLQASWNSAFTQSPPASEKDIVRDLQALGGTLKDLHGKFSFGLHSYSKPHFYEPHVTIENLTDEIKAGRESAADLRRPIEASMGLLTPADMLGARVMLFGRQRASFLTAKNMSSPLALATAWSKLFEGNYAPIRRDGGVLETMEDLAILAIVLSQVGFVEASKLWGVVHSVSSGDSGVISHRVQTSRLIQEIGVSTLEKAREELFGEKAGAKGDDETTTTALEPVGKGKIKVQVKGKPFELSADGIRVYPRIDDPADRTAVRRNDETKDRAAQNMQAAIERYLSKMIQADHASLINTHVTAIINGEIGAPVEMREAAVDYIAQSPEHAEAYGLKVLQEALIANVLISPLSVIVDLKGLIVRKKGPPKRREPEVGRAKMTRGSADNVSNMAWDVQGLLEHHSGVMADMARVNPGAFSRENIGRLVTAANIVDQIQRMSGPEERVIQHLIDAEYEGMIPEGFIDGGRDKGQVKVPVLERVQKTPAEWARAINVYISGDDFRSDVEDRPQDSSKYPFAQVLNDLYVRYGHRSALSGVYTLVHKGEYDEARRAIIRFWTNQLEKYIELLTEMGLNQMDNFSGLVESYVRDGNLRHAEALLDFVQDWTFHVRGLIEMNLEVSDKLRMVGEQSAKESFEATADRLLKAGDIDSIHALRGNVNMQLRDLKVTAKAKQALLTSKVCSALLFVLESARAIGALPDAKSRAPIALKLPSINEMLAVPGPINEMQVRDTMRRLGIPVPGEPNVPALGTITATGFRLPAPKQGRALEAPKERK